MDQRGDTEPTASSERGDAADLVDVTDADGATDADGVNDADGTNDVSDVTDLDEDDADDRWHRDEESPERSPAWRSRRGVRSLAVGLAGAGVLAFLLFGVIGTGPGSQSGQVVPIGSLAPDFTLPRLGGGPPVNLDALGRGRHRPVVLNFFASWCTPCQVETPLLASVARREQSAHSTVQFVGVDVGDLPSKAMAFVQQAGVDYPVAVDADLTVTAGRYGLNGEPQTFFLDPSGHVVAHKLGALDRSELESDLHQIAA